MSVLVMLEEKNTINYNRFEIKLDKNGRLRLNLFSHATDSYSNSLDYSQRNGVGIVYQQGFDSFRQLFRKRTIEEKESRRQIKELKKLQRAERHKKAKANTTNKLQTLGQLAPYCIYAQP